MILLRKLLKFPFVFVLLMILTIVITGCATTATGPGTSKTTGDKLIQVESVIEMKDRVTILLNTEGKIDYTPYRLESPLRLVVDIPNAVFEESGKKLAVDNGTISTINQLNMTTDGKNVARLEIFLIKDTNYLIPEQIDNKLKIEIQKLSGITTTPSETTIPPSKKDSPTTEEKKWTNPATKIVDVSKSESASSTVIAIVADGFVKDFESFVLEKPHRLVIDISGVKSNLSKKSIEVGNKDVKNIRVGIHPSKVRFVLESGLSSGLNSYNVYSKENKLMIVFGDAIDTASETDTTKTTTTPSKTPSSGKTVKINEVKYEDKADVSRVVISTNGTADYTTKMISDLSVVVDIPNALIDSSLNKSIDVSVSGGPIKSIKTYLIEIGGVKSVRVIVELSKRVAYNYFSEGTNVIVDFSKKEGVALTPETTKIEGDKIGGDSISTGGTTPLAQPATTLPGEPTTTPIPEVVTPSDTIGLSEDADGEGKKYSGKKVSLIFENVSIRRIFLLLAEESQLNIIVDNDVGGIISLRLIKVPWDQALDIILKARDLGMERTGNVVRITTNAILDRERREELTSRRSQEELEDLITRKVDLSYASLADIQTVIEPMLTDRGSITAFSQTQSLLITDIATRLNEVLRVIKKLDVATPEIRLEVRIVEASDNFSEELGINWVMSQFDNDSNHGYSGSKSTGGTLSNAFTTATGTMFDSGFGALFPAVPSSALGVGGASVVVGLLEDTLRLDIQLRALESMGEVEIVESPKIRVLNNVAASLTITRSIPIRNVSTSTDDSGNVSTEAEITTTDITTDLQITPTITADKRVKLDIVLSHTTLGDPVSITLDGVLNTYYITDTKNIDTEVLVNNRDTVVIGGLYRKRKSETELGLPLLKDIPLLGWLFKTKTTSDARRELLIFVTPTIIRENEGVISGIDK